MITTIKSRSRVIYWAKNMDIPITAQVSKLDKLKDTKMDLRKEEETRMFNYEFHVFDKTIIKDYYHSKKDMSSKHGLAASTIGNKGVLVFLSGKLIYFSEGKINWEIPFLYKVSEIKKDNSEGFWFCLGEQKGILYFKNLDAVRKNQFQTFLPNLTITNFHQDKNGGIWITSHESGVFHCSLSLIHI